MKVLFLGGDKRYLEIINNLNCDIDLIGYSKETFDKNVTKYNVENINFSVYNIIFLPMSGINEFKIKSLDGDIYISKEKIDEIDSKTIVYTGLISDVIKNKNVISFLDDLDFLEKNNSITVDGIIDKIKDLNYSNVCLLGYGNIGKLLAPKLDYTLKIGILNNTDYLNENFFYTNDTKKFKEILKNTDLIINTVPNNIIGEELVKEINQNCFIIDIASYPHGIDEKLIKKYNLNYYLYLGIPGKFKPEKSGKILLKKIEKRIEENK